VITSASDYLSEGHCEVKQLCASLLAEPVSIRSRDHAGYGRQRGRSVELGCGVAGPLWAAQLSRQTLLPSEV